MSPLARSISLVPLGLSWPAGRRRWHVVGGPAMPAPARHRDLLAVFTSVVGRRTWHVVRGPAVPDAAGPFAGGGIAIRAARAEDVPRLMALGRHEARTFARWLQPDHVFWVAVDGRRPVAWRCVSDTVPPMFRPELRLADDEGWVMDVYADPACRGHELGRALAAAMSPALAARGVRTLVCAQRPDHEGSVAMTAAAGWQRTGRLRRWNVLGMVWLTYAQASTTIAAHATTGWRRAFARSSGAA